jgi:hypothetical protein
MPAYKLADLSESIIGEYFLATTDKSLIEDLEKYLSNVFPDIRIEEVKSSANIPFGIKIKDTGRPYLDEESIFYLIANFIGSKSWEPFSVSPHGNTRHIYFRKPEVTK